MNHNWKANKHFLYILLGFRKTHLSLIILMLFFCGKASGQNSKINIDGYSINPKVGFFYWTNADGGFIKGAELNILQNNFIYSADFYQFEEFTFLGPTPSEYHNQIGVMIGKYKGDKIFRLQYQAGVAAFWGIKRTELIYKDPGMFSFTEKYDSKQFFTAGLTTKLGLKIIPLPFLSIGIDLQANFNPERSTYMPMISIEIGKLRNKINKS